MLSAFNNIKKIALVAPAGPPLAENVKKVVDIFFHKNIEVVLGKSVKDIYDVKYLSSSISMRVDDIHSMWSDSTIDCVISAKGGYGSAQLLPFLNWKLLEANPKPFIGFSDITALHLAMYKNGVKNLISGPMLSYLLKMEDDDYSSDSLAACFNLKPYSFIPLKDSKFKVLKRGKGEGSIIPVTLSVLVTLIGTPYLPSFKKSILLIEDINEPVYKLDRYLTQLVHSGVLNRCNGLLLGYFTRCGNLKDRLKLFSDFAENFNFPVIANIPFGHKLPRLSVSFGDYVTIEDDKIHLVHH